ncbi:MAG TPA: hypothetical protein DD979_03850 [Gammaproteobacteria bacterium]|jgi:glycosyltransferase involved in cell wall biosynthesis|nr:hypothetical protein [Gammaproteobacteria bacterium]
MKTRVLIVTDEMEVGGSQRQITHILTHLDRARFEPTLLYFRKDSYLLDTLHAQGVECVKIDKNGALDVRFLMSLVRFLRERHFDVVHAFAFTAELWTAIALLGNRSRLITSVRGRYEWYSPLQWRLKGWVSRCSSQVVSNSQAGLAYAAEQCGLDTDKATVVYNGIAMLDTQPAADALRDYRAKHAYVISFVGRLVDHKNLPCLLRALARLTSRGLDAGLILVGDGPLRAALEAQCEALELQQHVYFLGERDDVTAIFSDSDVAVLPSFREGFSNTLLEAMLVGTPMVASRVGGTPEVIDNGVNGLLFESDDDAQFADQLARVLTDPSLANSLGERGRDSVQARFAMPVMIDQMQSLYEARECDDFHKQ